MQRDDLIKSSGSPYLAMMVVVPKLDGALRVCKNFRRVNWPYERCVPHDQIEEHLNDMGGAKVFNSLDLMKGIN